MCFNKQLEKHSESANLAKIESLVVFCHSQHPLKISERSFHIFLSYRANTQTVKQTLAKT